MSGEEAVMSLCLNLARSASLPAAACRDVKVSKPMLALLLLGQPERRGTQALRVAAEKVQWVGQATV